MNENQWSRTTTTGESRGQSTGTGSCLCCAERASRIMAERQRYEPLLKIIRACERALCARNDREFNDVMRSFGVQATVAVQNGDAELIAACSALAAVLPEKKLDHDVLPTSCQSKRGEGAKLGRTFAKSEQMPEELHAELVKRSAKNPTPNDEGALL